MKQKNPKKPITIETKAQKASPFFIKKERICDCVPSFFHSKFPSITQEMIAAPGTTTHKFNDVIYNTTNNPYIFTIDVDGALLIHSAGTYMATFDLAINNITGGTVPCAVAAYLVLETPVGYSPYATQQNLMLFEPVAQDSFQWQSARYHANMLLHVGDVNLGIPYSKARLEVWLSADGDIGFAPEMHLTLVRL